MRGLGVTVGPGGGSRQGGSSTTRPLDYSCGATPSYTLFILSTPAVLAGGRTHGAAGRGARACKQGALRVQWCCSHGKAHCAAQGPIGP